jgi:membrane-bound serine protease (ClpP class)
MKQQIINTSFIKYLLFAFFFLFSINNFLANTDSITEKIDSVTEKTDTLRTEFKEDNEITIFHFELKEDITPAAWRLVNKATQQAKKMNADVIIMELNTYGGMVNMADSIRTRFINTNALTVSWINNNAASAGALISIACDSIYMTKGANIGAATVVDGTGSQLPDKYQSYMRSTMRSTAEAKNRDPRIAEAMVDDRIKIEGIIDSGQVLTFTTSEAIKNNFCEGEANSLDEVIEKLGIEKYNITSYKAKPIDKVIAFLLNPIVSSILMLMIFGGIYFELQTPGVGFPLAAAVLGAILYFAPLYLEGLADNWEILLFILGLILISVEIFVIPGFGVAGILGITFVVAGLTLSLIENDFFDFSFTPKFEISRAFIRVVGTLSGGMILMAIFGKSLFNTPAMKRIMLMDTQRSDEGYVISHEDQELLLGTVGVAITDLRPSGKVEINDELYDAVTEGGFITRGSNVKVIKTEGYSIIVRKV